MQEKQNKTAIIWFRNDLRTLDNVILHSAIQSSKNIIAVYCFDPRHFKKTSFGFKKTGKYRARFLIETIEDLKYNLSNLNINLLTFQNKPEQIIPRLVKKYLIDALYFQKEWTQEEVFVANNVKYQLPKDISIIEDFNQFLYHPEDIPMSHSEIPNVFTAFRKSIENKVSIRATLNNPEKITSNISTENISIPTLHDLGFNEFENHPNSAFPFEGGETSALERLQNYFFETKQLGHYKETRNGLIGLNYSSKLSAWLANGSISARTIYYAVKQFETEFFSNESTYWLIFELIWRDYFKYISLKYGNAIFKLGGILNKDYDWNHNAKNIELWTEGLTNEPFVNANMIELNKTGWMSNRGRQNVASYFAKKLELDWRIGASYFESLLIDYDAHSNYGNWMYVAGVGNDPRDRKFNIQLQADRYDPNWIYQNLWL